MGSDARQVLARAIEERNDDQGKGGATRIAKELGCTPSLVSQLAAGSYPERPAKKWYQLIIERYGNETVQCPVLGEIPLQRCKEEQGRPYSTANPIRGELSRTCPSCKRKP